MTNPNGVPSSGPAGRRNRVAVERLTGIRSLTIRKHNLDARVIEKLNAVIRGVARYFVTSFSTVREQFRYLDAWIRRRIRCMKFKRKSDHDNWRLRIRHIRRMGLAFLMDHLKPTEGQVGRAPDTRAILMGSPGARKGHAGKYGEPTPLRQRGGSGTPLP